ncbi:uncharacterized protein LOC123676290 isoform X2 [Harmonia axyridis]|uniref:uncharacterized protein LOC123676290 isoform X2 n=1 Tax=Harmonia axyridis TaxID=115357 RepID=UPI001E278162|nr:uncharacterized protein LOC123676290 isoform X2 [Harmonia axyridis]
MSSLKKQKWNNKQIITFLKIFESYELLWNMRHEDYTKKKNRIDCFNKLLKDLISIGLLDETADIKFLRTKIKCLKDAFRQELTKIAASKKVKPDNKEVYKPKLAWFEHARFWMDFMGSRTFFSMSSVDVESPPPEVKIEMDENMPGPSDESYTDTFESIVKTEPGLQEVKPQPDITASYNTKSDEVEDAEDACGYFGKYVAAELRSLPLKQRTLIKQEIQNCITHAVVGHISNLGDSESMKEENGSLSASSSNS